MPVLRGSIVAAVVTQEPPGATETLTIIVKATVDQVRATLDLGTLADEALDTVIRAKAFGAAGAQIEVAAAGDNSPAIKAELDLGAETENVDTVIEATVAGSAGDAITIAFVADGTGAGSFTRSVAALTFHFEDGVTTVTNFESAVAALAGGDDIIGVKTAGTGANILAAPGDVLAATNLAGGDDTEGATVVEDGTTVTIHYVDGESTVANVEAAIAESTLIEVDTTGTGATVLDQADDDFEATALEYAAIVLNVDEAGGRARHDGSGAPPPCDAIPGQAINITVDGDGVVTAVAFAS